MTEASDNPAGRLHALLKSALRFQQQKTYREVWSDVFEIAAEDTPSLLSLYGKLIDLIGDARESVDQLENVEKAIYLEPFDEIDRAFSYFNFDSSWQPTRDHLTDATMRSLAFAADTLARAQWTSEVEQEELHSLLEAVTSLLLEVQESDLSEEVQAFLIASLHDIQRAIIEYKIRGVDGLEEALGRSIGSAMRHRDAIRAQHKMKPVRKWFKVLGQLDSVVSVALKVKQLVDPVIAPLLTSTND